MISNNMDLISIEGVPHDKGHIRKLSDFGDLEGKTRIIGVIDYFSQSTLKPIHS